MNLEKMGKLQRELLKQENWTPKYSQIARKTGVKMTTVYDNCRRMLPRLRLHVQVLPEYKAWIIKEKGGQNGRGTVPQDRN